MENLLVFNAGNIIPVIIYLAGEIKSGTKTAFTGFFAHSIRFSFCRSIVETNFTGNLNIIGFLFQRGYPNAQGIQFVSKFSGQFVNVSASCQGFRYDLSHFITCHQTVATEGVVAIAFDNAGSS